MQNQTPDATKKLNAGLWRRLIRYLKPFHKNLIAIMATMAMSALCDALFPLLTREAIDQFTNQERSAGAIAGFSAKYVGLVLLDRKSVV